MKKLAMLVGPPGSGKSTIAKNYAANGYVYINQDLQGKEHLALFDEAILSDKDVVVDRMNFSKGQRARYLEIAKSQGYFTSIIVLHESYDTCFKRCVARKDHATITREEHAKAALHTFFTKYERVEDNEADDVGRVWPGGEKPSVILCDLDGTLCNVDHRLHHVRNGNKNWPGFFAGIKDDTINQWCADILRALQHKHWVIYCSGRGEEERAPTELWLKQNNMWEFESQRAELYMRPAKTSRKDSIVKEIILEFEILTRYTPFFVIDDRQQVVDMWRQRGLVCLQCAKGDF